MDGLLAGIGREADVRNCCALKEQWPRSRAEDQNNTERWNLQIDGLAATFYTQQKSSKVRTHDLA